MDLAASHNQQFDLARNAGEVAGLDALRKAAKSGDGEALEKAAQEFEAIFLRMMLKSMRQAQETMADESSPFNSQQVKFYRDMHDQQLASDLAAGDGLGLAEIIVQQLGGQQQGYLPASAVRNDGNLPSTLPNADATGSSKKTAPSKIHVGYKASGFADKQAFVDKLMPAIEPVAKQLGIDPNNILAQAALETGWGQQMIHAENGNNSYNLFGIKAKNGWAGEQASVTTIEFNNGIAKKERANFRVYASVEQSIQDYASFIQQPRYQAALDAQTDSQSYFSALQHAGYATDPQYAQKALNIVKRLVE